jgi:hypothetical protein
VGLLWGHFAPTQRRTVFKKRASAKKRKRRYGATQLATLDLKTQRMRALRMGLCRRLRMFIDPVAEAQLRGVGLLR